MVRWYHFYFVLALFDAAVIMISLRMHSETLGSAKGLIEAAYRLDDQSEILQSIQRRVIQLNSPGNDLFGTTSGKQYDILLTKFRIAKSNMDAVMARAMRDPERFARPDAGNWDQDLKQLQETILNMEAEAETLFAMFRPLTTQDMSTNERDALLFQAGPAMARMDQLQHQALQQLGMLVDRNADFRLDLLKNHEASLVSRYASERYIVALVILILVGILAFGRRLQQTDRALAEERRRLTEERRERLAAIGELCSSVAHGIRNPLAAIRSSAQLALELGRMDEDSHARLRDILDEGRRLGDRVTGLLNMARSNEEGFENMNLADVVTLAARELKPELSRRGIALREDISPSALPIFGDRRYLEQCVIELLSNAMEQSKSGDVITVTCRAAGIDGMAAVSVEDQGPGVPDAVRERVFDLFFTTKVNGTGIGLATVKRITRLHGGDVHVRDAATAGAKFEILLPMRRAMKDRGGRGHRGKEMPITAESE